MNCIDCKFAVFVDYGYSNYTVEGTTFSCALGAHPDGEFDRFYGEDKRLEFANECPKFAEGEAIHMDVESQELPNLTPDQLAIWEMDLFQIVSVRK